MEERALKRKKKGRPSFWDDLKNDVHTVQLTIREIDAVLDVAIRKDAATWKTKRKIERSFTKIENIKHRILKK